MQPEVFNPATSAIMNCVLMLADVPVKVIVFVPAAALQVIPHCGTPPATFVGFSAVHESACKSLIAVYCEQLALMQANTPTTNASPVLNVVFSKTVVAISPTEAPLLFTILTPLGAVPPDPVFTAIAVQSIVVFDGANPE